MERKNVRVPEEISQTHGKKCAVTTNCEKSAEVIVPQGKNAERTEQS